MFAILPLAADTGSKAPFEILAACLILYMLGVAGFGISHVETFPPSKRALTGILAVSVALVAGTMVAAVLTA